MANITLFHSEIAGQARARMIIDEATGQPVRVDVQGRTGQYKLVIRRGDRTKEVLFDFDSTTMVSKQFPPNMPSVYGEVWEFGIQAVNGN